MDTNILSSTYDPKNLTVAMVTMNEAGSVSKVIQDIKTVVPGAEILLVDSSTDNTPDIAFSLGARVIRQFPPRGYGPALGKALSESTGKVVVTMDCDGTYPAEQISVLAELILREGYDIVDASRLKKKPKAMPWSNFFANVSFAFLASLLFWTRLTDLHSGMRAYRKTMLNTLQFKTDGDALPVELLLVAIKRGFKMKTVFIDYNQRIGQSTLRPFRTAWWTLKRILRVRFLS